MAGLNTIINIQYAMIQCSQWLCKLCKSMGQTARMGCNFVLMVPGHLAVFSEWKYCSWDTENPLKRFNIQYTWDCIPSSGETGWIQTDFTHPFTFCKATSGNVPKGHSDKI